MSEFVRLLVVDDDELDRLAVRRALRKAGMEAEIVEAPSAREGLEALESGPFDCVLLDYQLPGGDGMQFLSEARARGYSTPVVVLTGQGDDEVAARLIKAGASDYLSKASLNPERLAQSIRSAIRVWEAEAKAREAEEALRASEARFRILHETSPDGFMIFRVVRNDDGEMVDAIWEYTNPAGERLSGHPAESLIGRRLLEVMPTVRATGLFDLYRSVVETGKPGQMEVSYEREGEPVWIRVTAARLGDGFALGWSDETPRRRAELEREQAMTAQSRFYAAMSHELRTPINAMIGYSDLLLFGAYGPLSPEQQHGIERAHRAAQHLLELVNDVLDLSKLEAGKLEIRLETVRLEHLVRDLHATIQPVAAERGIEVRLDFDGCPASIQTDPRRLRQILLNLLSNALKFGRGKPVDVRCRRGDDGTVTLEVSDQGAGIAPDQIDRVFEEFVQLEASAEGGTGLGLAISRRLAQLLGGTLEVQSEVGRGSTFRVTLPIGSTQEEPAADTEVGVGSV